MRVDGLEPSTACLKGRSSTTELHPHGRSLRRRPGTTLRQQPRLKSNHFCRRKPHKPAVGERGHYSEKRCAPAPSRPTGCRTGPRRGAMTTWSRLSALALSHTKRHPRGMPSHNARLLCRTAGQFPTLSSSTSNTRVALGGIAAPIPRAP